MNDANDIPLLTDLIESGSAIKMSDLGLDEPAEAAPADTALADTTPADTDDLAPGDMSIDPQTTADIVTDEADNELHGLGQGTANGLADGDFGGEISPVLEQTIRRILDEHMELALQEIRIAVQQYLDRS